MSYTYCVVCAIVHVGRELDKEKYKLIKYSSLYVNLVRLTFESKQTNKQTSTQSLCSIFANSIVIAIVLVILMCCHCPLPSSSAKKIILCECTLIKYICIRAVHNKIKCGYRTFSPLFFHSFSPFRSQFSPLILIQWGRFFLHRIRCLSTWLIFRVRGFYLEFVLACALIISVCLKESALERSFACAQHAHIHKQ